MNHCQSMLYILAIFAIAILVGSADFGNPNNVGRRETYKVVKDETGRFILVHFQKQFCQLVPDGETVEALGYDVNLLHTISNTVLMRYRWSDVAFPSMANGGNAIEKAVRMALGFANTEELLKNRLSIPNKLNPVVIRWHGRWFATWRNGMYDSPINFAWVDLKEDSVHFLADDHFWGVGLDNVTTIKLFPFNNLQEDPRLLPLPHGKLAVTYTSKVSLFKAPKQCYFYILSPSVNEFDGDQRALIETQRLRGRLSEPPLQNEIMSISDSNDWSGITLTDSVLLDGHPYQRGQKNWVMLHHNDSLYFVNSINPLRLLKHTETQEDRTGMLETVFEMDSPIELPWNNAYGSDIRGGTPAIFLKKWGVYLAFFHTVAQLKAPKDQERTYFMGAITFCPQFPFHIKSISPFPIVANEFYEGPLVNPRNVNYVVFPVGIQEDESHDFVWISFGVRDKDGWLAKVNIKDLSETLADVQSCE